MCKLNPFIYCVNPFCQTWGNTKVFVLSRVYISEFVNFTTAFVPFHLKYIRFSSLFQSVEGEHHEKAVELLKAAQGTVKLVVRYTPKVLEEMESRFEKMRSAKRRQQNSYPQ